MDLVAVVTDPLATSDALVGRRSSLVADAARADRFIGVDVWYPARSHDGELAMYELLPGVGFTSVARRDAECADGPHPTVILSHGRSGTRLVYSQLCESLAARGVVVVALDHPGDTMADWLLGAAVDDETNESNRVADIACVLHELDGGLFADVQADLSSLFVAGHSYGAYAAVGFAATNDGQRRLRGAMGLEPFLRTVREDQWSDATCPLAFWGGDADTTTPPDVDIAAAERHARRVDTWEFTNVGHQGCSDVGLYLELSAALPDLPAMVTDYLGTMAAQVTGRAGDPWRPTVARHVEVVHEWITHILTGDAHPAATRDGLRRRTSSTNGAN